MHPQRLRQFLMTFLPAMLALAVVALALFGENGLLRRHDLRRQLIQVNEEVTRLEEENRDLRWEIRQLQDNAQAVRRAAAEELLMAPPGSTIYRFNDAEPGADQGSDAAAPAVGGAP